MTKKEIAVIFVAMMAFLWCVFVAVNSMKELGRELDKGGGLKSVVNQLWEGSKKQEVTDDALQPTETPNSE